MANKKKGFYLNDVPVDVFLDYFDKTTYGENIENTPVMIDSYDMWLVPRLDIFKTKITNQTNNTDSFKFKVVTHEKRDIARDEKIGSLGIITINKPTLNTDRTGFSETPFIRIEENSENNYYYSGYKNLFYFNNPPIIFKNPDVEITNDILYTPEITNPALKDITIENASTTSVKNYNFYLEPETKIYYNGEEYVVQSWESTNDCLKIFYIIADSEIEGSLDNIPGRIINNEKVDIGSYYKNIKVDGIDHKQLLTCYTITGTQNIKEDTYVIDNFEEHYDEYDHPFLDINGEAIIDKTLNEDEEEIRKVLYLNKFSLNTLDKINSKWEEYFKNLSESDYVSASSFKDLLEKLNSEIMRESFILYSSELKDKIQERLIQIDNNLSKYIDLDQRDLLKKEKDLLQYRFSQFNDINRKLSNFSFGLNQIGDYTKYVYSENLESTDGGLTSKFKIYVIVEGNNYKVPHVNDKGENLYRDNFGLLTTKKNYKNNFYIHQDAIRRTFFGITKNTGWMYRANPRHVVILSNKGHEEFAYYDEYVRQTYYKECGELPADASINVSKQVIPKEYLQPNHKITEARTKFQTKIKDINEFPQYNIYSNYIEANSLRPPIMFYYDRNGDSNNEERFRYDYYAFRCNDNDEDYLGNYITANGHSNNPNELDITINIDGEWPGRFKTIRGFYNDYENLVLKKGIKMAVKEKQYMVFDDKNTPENELETTAVTVDKVYSYTTPGFYAQDTTYIDDDSDLLLGERKYDFNRKLSLTNGKVAKYNGKRVIYIKSSSYFKYNLSLEVEKVLKLNLICNRNGTKISKWDDIPMRNIFTCLRTLYIRSFFNGYNISYSNISKIKDEISQKIRDKLLTFTYSGRGFYSYQINDTPTITINFDTNGNYTINDITLNISITKEFSETNENSNGASILYNGVEYIYFNRDGFYDKIPCQEIFTETEGNEEKEILIETIGAKINYKPIDSTEIEFNNIKYTYDLTKEEHGYYNDNNEELSVNVTSKIKLPNIFTDLLNYNTNKLSVNSSFNVKNVVSHLSESGTSSDKTINNYGATRVEYDDKIYEYNISNSFQNIDNLKNVLNYKSLTVENYNGKFYWDESKLRNNNLSITPTMGDKFRTGGIDYFYNGSMFISDDGTKAHLSSQEGIFTIQSTNQQITGSIWDPKKRVITRNSKLNEIVPKVPIIYIDKNMYEMTGDQYFTTKKRGITQPLNVQARYGGINGYYFNMKDGLQHSSYTLRGPTEVKYKKDIYKWDPASKKFFTKLPENVIVSCKNKLYKWSDSKLTRKIIFWEIESFSPSDNLIVEYNDKFYQYQTINGKKDFYAILGLKIFYLNITTNILDFWREPIKTGYWIIGDKIINADGSNINKDEIFQNGRRILSEEGDVYIYNNNRFYKLLQDERYVHYDSKSRYYKEYKKLDVFYRPLFDFKFIKDNDMIGKKVSYKDDNFVGTTITGKNLFVADKSLSFRVVFNGEKNWYWNGEILAKNNNTNNSFEPSSGTIAWVSNGEENTDIGEINFKNNKLCYWNGTDFIEIERDHKTPVFNNHGVISDYKYFYPLSDPKNIQFYFGPFKKPTFSFKCNFKNKSVDYLKKKQWLLHETDEKILDVGGSKSGYEANADRHYYAFDNNGEYKKRSSQPGYHYSSDFYLYPITNVSYKNANLDRCNWDGIQLRNFKYDIVPLEPTIVSSLDKKIMYIWRGKYFVDKDKETEISIVDNFIYSLPKNTQVFYNNEIYQWTGKVLKFVPITPKSSTAIKFMFINYYYHKNTFRPMLIHNNTNTVFKDLYFYHFNKYSVWDVQKKEYTNIDTPCYWCGETLKNESTGAIIYANADYTGRNLSISLPLPATSFLYKEKMYQYDPKDSYFKCGKELFTMRVDKIDNGKKSSGWIWNGKELIGRPIPLPYKLKPGDGLVYNDKIYRYHVGFVYHKLSPLNLSKSITYFYNGEEYLYNGINPLTNKHSFKLKSNEKQIQDVYDGMEIFTKNGTIKEYSTYLYDAGTRNQNGQFYRKAISDGSIIYSPELKSRVGSINAPVSISEKNESEFVILNILNRVINFKNSKNIISYNNNDGIYLRSEISTEKLRDSDFNGLTSEDLKNFDTTIYQAKSDEPFILIPIITKNINGHSLTDQVGKYLTLEVKGISQTYIYNGEFKTSNKVNANNAAVYIDFNNGELEAEILTEEELGLDAEDIPVNDTKDIDAYFVKILLEPIKIETCRKMLCEISPVEGKASTAPVTMNETKLRQSEIPVKTIDQISASLRKNMNLFLMPLFNILASNVESIKDAGPIKYYSGIPETVATTSTLVIPKFFKDSYRISDCIYLKDFIDDKVGDFFDRLSSNNSEKDSDPEFLEYLMSITGEDDLEQEKCYDERTDNYYYTSNFIHKEYFENYYNVELPYIEKIVSYKLINGTELDQFPSTVNHPDFTATDIPGVVTPRFTVQQHYKEAGRYFEDEESKLRGKYVPENVFFNRRKKSVGNMLTRILNNEEDNEINIQREASDSDGFTNLYNYCKGMNFYIYNDIDFSYRKVCNERPLNNIKDQTYKIILENKYYSGMLGDGTASINAYSLLTDDEKTLENNLNLSEIKINVKEIEKHIRGVNTYDNRPLLERLVDYEKYPLNKMYEDYLGSIKETDLSGAIVDNNVNTFHDMREPESQPHLQKYLKDAFSGISSLYVNSLINFVKEESEDLKTTIMLGTEYYEEIFNNKINSLQDYEHLKTNDTNMLTEKAVYNINEDEINDIIKKLVLIEDTNTEPSKTTNYMKWRLSNG